MIDKSDHYDDKIMQRRRLRHCISRWKKMNSPFLEVLIARLNQAFTICWMMLVYHFDDAHNMLHQNFF
jgi:hypothetical protein